MSRSQEEQEPASEGLELVQSGAEGRSLFESWSDHGSTHPETMIRLGLFANVVCGRIFILQASKLTDELLSGDKALSEIGTVSVYHTLFMASLLKKRIQTHHFYSKHLVDVLESNPKRRTRFADPDLLYKSEIREHIGALTDAAISLDDTIATEKKLYNEVLIGALEYPSFRSSCLQQIKDHKATLKEQVVNQDLKARIEKERDMIKFVGEVCSRLLAVTPIKSPRMVEAFLTTQDILNHINGIGQRK